MKQLFQIMVLSLLLISCKQSIQPEEIGLMNGYWEIEKVVFDNGEEKLYQANESYDYFEVDSKNKGFRKKVKPQLDGSFLVNDSYENIKVKAEESSFFIEYATPYAKWKEEIIAISKEKLVLKNQEKSEYHYKKALPLTILNDGKKK